MGYISTNIIEISFAIALFVNAALFLPQAWKIYVKHDGTSISLLTFGGFWITQLLTAMHAYINHDMILLTGYILALVTCGTVILLAIKYRKT